MRDAGYFPIALANYLGRLGHHYAQAHLLPLAGLGEHFNIESISRSPAHFDEVQLNHWQKEAVLQLDAKTFWDWIEPVVRTYVSADQAESFCDCIKQNVVFPKDAVRVGATIAHRSMCVGR